MYIIAKDTLINPLQVESILYTAAKLVLNAQGGGQEYAVVKMVSGQEFRMHSSNCGNVDEAVKHLVWQIDVANGMSFNKKKDDTEKKDD